MWNLHSVEPEHTTVAAKHLVRCTAMDGEASFVFFLEYAELPENVVFLDHANAVVNQKNLAETQQAVE